VNYVTEQASEECDARAHRKRVARAHSTHAAPPGPKIMAFAKIWLACPGKVCWGAVSKGR
ncbi:hypothetical protein BaRGS_00035680, partial [Batillaria attramentaria]